MRIFVWAHPRSSQKKLVLKDNIYHAYVHAPPEDGKANKEIIELVAKEFGVAKTSIQLKNPHARKKQLTW